VRKPDKKRDKTTAQQLKLSRIRSQIINNTHLHKMFAEKNVELTYKQIEKSIMLARKIVMMIAEVMFAHFNSGCYLDMANDIDELSIEVEYLDMIISQLKSRRLNSQLQSQLMIALDNMKACHASWSCLLINSVESDLTILQQAYNRHIRISEECIVNVLQSFEYFWQ